jgi:uncharacterized membrane protein HdeD (DUF308 family)
MLRSLTQSWWVFLVQGVAAILFGIGALGWPGLTLAVLIGLFSAFAIVDGVVALVAMFQAKEQDPPRWLFLLRGIVGIAAGLGALAYPGMTVLFLVFVIAARSLLSGILEIAAAIALRKELEHEWLMIASGVLSILFGIVLFGAPGAGALALAWMIGLFALAIGGLLVWLSFRLRGLRGRLETPQSAQP